MTFHDVQKLGDWIPIRDCPGRFVWQGASPKTSLAAWLGPGVAVQKFHSPKARDTVWVAPLDDGGLISYCRPDQTWTHTLCTASGFSRKLAQLEIVINAPVTY